MKVESIEITEAGMLSKGDPVCYTNKHNYTFVGKVDKVLFKGTDKEEIILNEQENDYFITSLYLNGKSWVKKIIRLNIDLINNSGQ